MKEWRCSRSVVCWFYHSDLLTKLLLTLQNLIINIRLPDDVWNGSADNYRKILNLWEYEEISNLWLSEVTWMFKTFLSKNRLWLFWEYILNMQLILICGKFSQNGKEFLKLNKREDIHFISKLRILINCDY